MPTYRKQRFDLVLDVRTRLEFWLGHLDGAECLPLQGLAGAMAKRTDIPKTTHLLVYCASGARSAAATAILQSLGYRHVVDAGPMSRARAEYAP
jgi:rhodanese-related sulfurtransferase